MKVYLNSETHSMVVSLADDEPCTFKDLAKTFTDDFNARDTKSKALSPSDVILLNPVSKKPLAVTDVVQKKVKDKGDVMVVLASQEGPSVSRAGQKDFADLVKEAYQLLNNEKKRGAAMIFKGILEKDPKHKVALEELSQIYFDAERWDEAELYTKRALALSTTAAMLTRLGCIYHEKKDSDAAVDTFNSVIEMLGADEAKIHDTYVLLGKSLLEKGELESATKLFLTIIKANEARNAEHTQSYLQYAKVLVERGQPQTALQICVRILIQDSKNQEVRQTFARALKLGNPLEIIEQQVVSSAASLAYLSLPAKDFGAVEESAILLRRATELAPTSASYMLNYVHTLEMTLDYQRGFEATKTFLRNNKTMEVGGVTCANVLEIVEKVTKLDAIVGAKVDFAVPTPRRPCDPKKVFSEADRDLLALFSTIVKIVYAAGALALVSPVDALLAPLREGRDLHKTTIRNENAYHSCISLLMKYHTLPFSETDKEPIYVCGDSHSTTLAWQTVALRGKKHLIKPLLVTGMKVWHLRPESDFYPKIQFYNSLKTIPDGSKVIFLFGEIDCRESFLVSVEKCRYDTVAEAASVAVDIYLKVLSDLKKKRKFEIFVHPVNSVIKETRAIVRLFNEILARKIKQTPGLALLDLGDQLLTEDKDALRPEYELDGIHINPTYLPLIEAALQAAVSQ